MIIRTSCFVRDGWRRIKQSDIKGTTLSVDASGIWCWGSKDDNGLGYIEKPLDDEGFVEIYIPDQFMRVEDE